MIPKSALEDEEAVALHPTVVSHTKILSTPPSPSSSEVEQSQETRCCICSLYASPSSARKP